MTEKQEIFSKIKNAQRIVIGAGAGLSASGGLNYANPQFVAQCFPQFASLGYDNIMHILSHFWRVSDENALQYYAVWARHFHNIRYVPKATEPYQLLKKIVAEKDYFVITTNVDKQFYKADFEEDNIFAMQGDYGLFQCVKPCSQALYDNQEWVETTLANMPDAFHIRAEDVPLCPNCGSYLVPNLRMDSTFVQQPHLKNAERYEHFMQQCATEPTVLLELGVGFNTPSIIRFPFEHFAKSYSETVTLIRINAENAQVPPLSNCFSVQQDIMEVLNFWQNS